MVYKPLRDEAVSCFPYLGARFLAQSLEIYIVYKTADGRIVKTLEAGMRALASEEAESPTISQFGSGNDCRDVL